MTKKIFITLFVVAITLIFSSFVLANTTDNMGTEMSDSWNKLSNTAHNMGNNVRGAIDNVGDTITGNKDNNNGDTNTGYTATRTATTANTGLFGMNSSTMWTWLVLGILGIAIVGLIWSYGKETSHNTH